MQKGFLPLIAWSDPADAREARQMRISGQVRYWSLTSLNITQMISDKFRISNGASAFYTAGVGLLNADWLQRCSE